MPVARFLVRCSGWWSRFWNGGNQWSGWSAYLSFFRHVAKLELPIYEKFPYYEAAAIHGGPRFMHQRFCIVSDFPTVVAKDERNRPHREDGPHIAWRDGWAIYSWHGVRVPAHVLEAPRTITVAEIEAETNAEVRRVMVSKYGAGRYLLDSGAKELARDEFGVLYRKEQANDEPLVMVRVLNSTPEPDGTLTTAQARAEFGDAVIDRACSMSKLNGRAGKAMWKEYFLRVHPELLPMVPPTKGSEVKLGEPQQPTARNAVASTFGLRGEDWAPTVET